MSSAAVEVQAALPDKLLLGSTLTRFVSFFAGFFSPAVQCCKTYTAVANKAAISLFTRVNLLIIVTDRKLNRLIIGVLVLDSAKRQAVLRIAHLPSHEP